MTETKENTKKATAKTTRRERLFVLARKNYEPRKATRWPYLIRGEQKYRFEGPERRSLKADLRALWREENPGENTPSDTDLNSVIDDLQRLARDADPDPADCQEEADQVSPPTASARYRTTAD